MVAVESFLDRGTDYSAGVQEEGGDGFCQHGRSSLYLFVKDDSKVITFITSHSLTRLHILRMLFLEQHRKLNVMVRAACFSLPL